MRSRSSRAVVRLDSFTQFATDEQELIPTGGGRAYDARPPSIFRFGLELTSSVRCRNGAQQQLLPVLAEVNTGTLHRIGKSPF